MFIYVTGTARLPRLCILLVSVFVYLNVFRKRFLYLVNAGQITDKLRRKVSFVNCVSAATINDVAYRKSISLLRTSYTQIKEKILCFRTVRLYGGYELPVKIIKTRNHARRSEKNKVNVEILSRTRSRSEVEFLNSRERGLNLSKSSLEGGTHTLAFVMLPSNRPDTRSVSD